MQAKELANVGKTVGVTAVKKVFVIEIEHRLVGVNRGMAPSQDLLALVLVYRKD